MSGYDRTVASWPNDMTLRDYFAAKAMQALIAHEEKALPWRSRNTEDFDKRVAYAAYRYADGMLAAREAK